jgi:hypothetical protein
MQQSTSFDAFSLMKALGSFFSWTKKAGFDCTNTNAFYLHIVAGLLGRKRILKEQ